MVVALLMVLVSCIAKPPIRVGFVAELTGKQSEPGVNLRNSVQMAVDEINLAGGIDGRRIELKIEDDLGTPEGARVAENRLIDSGVVAVIGHYTSNQTLEGYAVTQQRGTILISGTASTSLLSGKKDLFFRSVVATDTMGQGFAYYIRQQRGLARIAILYDQDNNTYAEPMSQAFSETFRSLGGNIVDQVKFSAAAAPDFAPLVKNLKTAQPDGILLIASPTNSAVIAQVIYLSGWRIPLFSSSWGQGDALIQNGGDAVEDMEIIIAIDINDPASELRDFKTRYQKLFSRPPIFTAIEGYETMQILATALKKTGGEANGLAEALMGLKNFQGLTGSIRLNEYGDAIRPLYIQKVHNRSFETIQKIDLLP
jgi:branched-chain amino acid transport system substrate-binding protein